MVTVRGLIEGVLAKIGLHRYPEGPDVRVTGWRVAPKSEAEEIQSVPGGELPPGACVKLSLRYDLLLQMVPPELAQRYPDPASVPFELRQGPRVQDSAHDYHSDIEVLLDGVYLGCLCVRFSDVPGTR